MTDPEQRVRLLEYQIDHLRRELTLLTQRHEAIVYSAAWTLARPLKWIEDRLHRIVASFARRPAPDLVATPPSRPSAREHEPAAIAARIAETMAQPPVRG